MYHQGCLWRSRSPMCPSPLDELKGVISSIDHPSSGLDPPPIQETRRPVFNSYSVLSRQEKLPRHIRNANNIFAREEEEEEEDHGTPFLGPCSIEFKYSRCGVLTSERLRGSRRISIRNFCK